MAEAKAKEISSMVDQRWTTSSEEVTVSSENYRLKSDGVVSSENRRPKSDVVVSSP